MMQLSVIVGAISIFLCGSAEQTEPQPTGVNRQMMDEAVIETVLVDVLTSSDDGLMRIRREQRSEELIFNNDCDDRVFATAGSIRRAKEKWEAAKLADAAAAREAGENVLDRLKRNELFAPFKPQDKRISIWKENPASTQPPYLTSVRPTRVGPPGYADEDRLAVVVLIFPGSNGMLGGRTTYLLHLDGKKWNVIARDIGFFV